MTHLSHFSSHSIHLKDWEYEKWIINNSYNCGKIPFFRVGKHCSFHYCKSMTEILYLQSGQTMIDFSHGDDISKSESLFVKLGESFHVPTGLRHQYVAIKDIEVFDISTEHFKSNSYHMVKGD